jgi:hypothetical protein
MVYYRKRLLTKVLSKYVSLNEKIKDYFSTELITVDVGIRAIEAADIMMGLENKEAPINRITINSSKWKEEEYICYSNC